MTGTSTFLSSLPVSFIWPHFLWLLLVLPLLLIACGSQPPTTRIVVIEPPEAIMLDCPRPGSDLSTNQAITDSLIACHARIVDCNLSRQSAREYIEAAKKRSSDGPH